MGNAAIAKQKEPAIVNEEEEQEEQDQEEEEEDRKPAAKRKRDESEEETDPSKQTKLSNNQNDDDNNSDDAEDNVVQVLTVPPTFAAEAAARAATPSEDGNSSNNNDKKKDDSSNDPEGDNNDDVQFLRSTGLNALVDFPHAREHCLVHPMTKQCDNGQHTNATATTTTKDEQNLLHCPNCYCYVCDMPAQKCDTWTEHCHAVSTNPMWQAKRRERKHPMQQQKQQSSSYLSYGGGSSSVQDLLAGVTRVYPSERSPPASAGFVTALKHYQKQSLAFMCDVEEYSNDRAKSGWLCSEVGMGKSAVVIALIVTQPLMDCKLPTEEDAKEARYEKTPLNVKGTVLFTNKSLMGQWEGEFQKHAPNVKVYRHYGKTKLKLADLAHADVIISTPTVEWSKVFQTKYKFHRVVIDESHLLGTVSARLNVVSTLNTQRRWCITATPMVSSVSDLVKQAQFLGLYHHFKFDSCTLEFLERHMLRHLKKQMIDGSAALALPESTTEVKEIPMTQWERNTFREVLAEEGQRVLYQYQQRTRIVEMRWFTALMKPLTCEDSSKIVQLQKDLNALLEKEPNMRAVVFTQMKNQHKFACKAIRAMGLKVYKIEGSTSADYRDQAIREFQDPNSQDGGPAVFVVTVQTGSVGITLTAASHVFLLEPFIDPSSEVQAAGRILRLGQTKQVGVTKYYFPNSCESQILKLHKEIEAGTVEFTSGLLSSRAMDILELPFDL